MATLQNFSDLASQMKQNINPYAGAGDTGSSSAFNIPNFVKANPTVEDFDAMETDGQVIQNYVLLPISLNGYNIAGGANVQALKTYAKEYVDRDNAYTYMSGVMTMLPLIFGRHNYQRGQDLDHTIVCGNGVSTFMRMSAPGQLFPEFRDSSSCPICKFMNQLYNDIEAKNKSTEKSGTIRSNLLKGNGYQKKQERMLALLYNLDRQRLEFLDVAMFGFQTQPPTAKLATLFYQCLDEATNQDRKAKNQVVWEDFMAGQAYLQISWAKAKPQTGDKYYTTVNNLSFVKGDMTPVLNDIITGGTRTIQCLDGTGAPTQTDILDIQYKNESGTYSGIDWAKVLQVKTPEELQDIIDTDGANILRALENRFAPVVSTEATVATQYVAQVQPVAQPTAQPNVAQTQPVAPNTLWAPDDKLPDELPQQGSTTCPKGFTQKPDQVGILVNCNVCPQKPTCSLIN